LDLKLEVRGPDSLMDQPEVVEGVKDDIAVLSCWRTEADIAAMASLLSTFAIDSRFIVERNFVLVCG